MNLRPDPTFHPTAKSPWRPGETLAFTLMLSPDGSQPDGLAVVDVDPPRDLRRDRPQRLHAQHGRRVSPFRLERLFVGPLAADRTRLSRTALPHHSRHPVVADLRDRREGAAEGEDPQDHRARGALRQDRLFAPAHHPLRSRGDLCLDAGRRRRGRHGRPPGIFIMDCETFEILGRYEMDRGRQDKHYDFWWNLPRDYMVSSRMGPAAAVRERAGARGPAVQQVRPHESISGTCARAGACRPSISARITRWRWRSGPPMTPPSSTASAAWWWTPPTCGRDLHLVAEGGRQLRGEEDHHHRPGAGRCGRPA